MSTMSAGRRVEALVWAVAGVTIIVALVFLPTKTARAATIGALFCGANFSLGRWALTRMLLLRGPAQRAFGLLYASKLSFLFAALGVLTFALRLDVLGLVIGFSALPLSMYLLLIAMLIWRRRAARSANKDR